MQAGGNKMLLPLEGHPLICWAVRAFARIDEIDDLIIVVQAHEAMEIRRLLHPIAPNARFIEGGVTRRDSALAGVRATRNELALIHDGARPFPSAALIHRVIAKAKVTEAAIPVLQITDLLHTLDSSGSTVTQLPPSIPLLARAQTPQGFYRALILQCLENAPAEIRDDATAVLWTGRAVSTVPGESVNVKITKPDDLLLAEAIAAHLEA